MLLESLLTRLVLLIVSQPDQLQSLKPPCDFTSTALMTVASLAPRRFLSSLPNPHIVQIDHALRSFFE
jgi:hypothetical protein